MTLPADSIIPSEKLTKYLLVPRPRSDKSKFLAMAGYSPENWEELEKDLRALLSNEAQEDETNEFGTFFSIIGKLRNLHVKTVWIWEKGIEKPRFVTLIPAIKNV